MCGVEIQANRCSVPVLCLDAIYIFHSVIFLSVFPNSVLSSSENIQLCNGSFLCLNINMCGNVSETSTILVPLRNSIAGRLNSGSSGQAWADWVRLVLQTSQSVGGHSWLCRGCDKAEWRSLTPVFVFQR